MIGVQLLLVLLLDYELRLLSYNSHRDGIAINTKTTAGAIVHMVLITCPSRMNHPVCLFWIIIIMV